MAARLIGSATERLSDIEYLAIKEFDNKRNDAEGGRTTTGAICTITANTGKDLYLGAAQINCSLTGTTGDLIVELRENGTNIETVDIQLLNETSRAATSSYTYNFKRIGTKVTAGQTFTLQATTITNITVEGVLVGFEENTGESPAINP